VADEIDAGAAKPMTVEGDDYDDAEEAKSDKSDSSDGAECWICYDADAGPLIHPCNCRGGVGAVHHDCLKRWLVEVCTVRWSNFDRQNTKRGLS
jgi:hypothetical protein